VRVIGLAGGIGSGKSAVSAMLARLGAEVIDADKLGHAAYLPGTAGFDAVVAEFGREVVAADGTIDRKKLGARVFSDPAALARLNQIVHPLIRTAIEERIEAVRRRGDVPAVIVEAAIMLEAGWRGSMDEIWVLSAPAGRIRERLAAQRGLDASEVDARAARQMSDEERRAKADLVIENDGSLADLEARIGEVWRARIAR